MFFFLILRGLVSTVNHLLETASKKRERNIFLKANTKNCLWVFTFLLINGSQETVGFFLYIGNLFLGCIISGGRTRHYIRTTFASLGIIFFIFDFLSIFSLQSNIEEVLSLSFSIPFLLCGFRILHLFYLHFLSSNNPLRNSTNNKIPFFPFIFQKDFFGFI